MPLSEDEQRILKEIEANLNEPPIPAWSKRSPRPPSTGTRPERSSGRCSASSAGLALLLFTFTRVLLLGVVGFLVMLGCLLVIERNVRKLGQGRSREPHQLDAHRDAQERVRQRRAPLARALASRRPRPDPAVAVSYTAAQAARLTGCSAVQLSSWERLGLVVPPRGSDAPVHVPGPRRAPGRRLAARCRPLAGPHPPRRPVPRRVGRGRRRLSLVTDGDTVWACRDDGQILDALRHGQLALFVAVDRVTADVAAEVHAFDAERQAFVDGLRDARTVADATDVTGPPPTGEAASGRAGDASVPGRSRRRAAPRSTELASRPRLPGDLGVAASPIRIERRCSSPRGAEAARRRRPGRSAGASSASSSGVRAGWRSTPASPSRSSTSSHAPLIAPAGSGSSRRRPRRRRLARMIATATPAATDDRAGEQCHRDPPVERESSAAAAPPPARRCSTSRGAARRRGGAGRRRRSDRRARRRRGCGGRRWCRHAVAPPGSRLPPGRSLVGGGLEAGPADAREPDLAPGVRVLRRDAVEVGDAVESAGRVADRDARG